MFSYTLHADYKIYRNLSAGIKYDFNKLMLKDRGVLDKSAITQHKTMASVSYIF